MKRQKAKSKSSPVRSVATTRRSKMTVKKEVVEHPPIIESSPEISNSSEGDSEEDDEDDDNDYAKQYTIAELMEDDDLQLSDIDPDCELPPYDVRMAYEAMKTAKAACQEFMFPRERRAAQEKQMEELLVQNRALQRQLEEREHAQSAITERALGEVLRLRAQLTRAVKVSATPAALPVPSAPGRDTAAAQIVELSKRERELSAELATAQNRARIAEAKLLKLRHTLNKMSGAPCPESGDADSTSGGAGMRGGGGGGDGGHGDAATPHRKASTTSTGEKPTLAQAKQQLQNATQRLNELHTQNEQLRNEMDVARQVLALEMGDAVAVAAALSGKCSGGSGGNNSSSNAGSGWRSRAQQVMALQQRSGDLRVQLKDAQEDLARLKTVMEEEAEATRGDPQGSQPCAAQEMQTQTDTWAWHSCPVMLGPTAGAKAAAAGAAARERRAAAEAAEAAAREAREAADVAERRLEAARARGQALEVTAASLRRRLEELLAESTNDDRVVAALSGQLREVTERLERGEMELEQVMERIERERSQLESELSEATATVSALQATIAEEENIIQRRLELQAQDEAMVSPHTLSRAAGSISGLSVAMEDSSSWKFERTPRSMSPMSRGSTESGPREAQTKEVLSVTDVDCARLLELASLQCGKIAEQAAWNARAEEEVLAERRRAAVLEAQRARLETTRQGAKARRALQLREAADSADADILAKLEILQEENEALRSGLQRTRLESEDDLRAMAEDMRRRGISKWSSPRGAMPDHAAGDTASGDGYFSEFS